MQLAELFIILGTFTNMLDRKMFRHTLCLLSQPMVRKMRAINTVAPISAMRADAAISDDWGQNIEEDYNSRK